MECGQRWNVVREGGKEEEGAKEEGGRKGGEVREGGGGASENDKVLDVTGKIAMAWIGLWRGLA